MAGQRARRRDLKEEQRSTDRATNVRLRPEMTAISLPASEWNARASLHGLTFAALEEALERGGIRPVHAAALWRALYRGGGEIDGAIPNFTPPLRRWLEHELGSKGSLTTEAPAEELVTHSSDALTQKFLLRLRDGETVETVLMRYPGRNTACVSTQAGCAMGCVFCATGQMGFTRHLAPHEIEERVIRWVKPARAKAR